MKTICFIETTKHGSSLEAIKAAKRLGFHTVLFTKKKSFMAESNDFNFISKIVLLESITEQVIENELIMLQQTGLVIKAILSFVDPNVSMAADLMNKFCGSNISVDALKIMEDKAATRIALEKNRVTPKFHIYELTEDISLPNELEYPVMIKSSRSKSSKDVYIIYSLDEMKKMIRKLNRIYPEQCIVLEEYLEGQQYLVEVIMHERKLSIVAVFKQYITKEIKFIVTGYEYLHKVSGDFQKKLTDAVTSILKDLNAINVACHLEMKYKNDEWKLIEINPRISGGAMNYMIKEAVGINLVEETITLYLGLIPKLTAKYERFLYTHFITISLCGYLMKVTGQKKATQLPGIKAVYIKPRIGDIVMPAVSMGHRYGYVIATGNSPTEAKLAAIDAANKISFYIEEI